MAADPDIKTITGPEALRQRFGVSRETVAKLEIYAAAVARWQKAVNLVAPSTIPEIWHRHFADSVQLASHIPENARRLVDLGSGGGFPGLVLAILFAEQGQTAVTLVESDQRKAAFLRDTARALEIPVDILSTRIESNATVQALSRVDVVTARALAPLDRLLDLAAPFLSDAATGVFLKGRDAAREIEEARKRWVFDVEEHESVTDAAARILVVRHLAPRKGEEVEAG